MGYVLIVEDDIVLARMYQKAMEIEGLTVAVAEDGEQGLAKIKAETPALVLLDIMMPKMSGYQVLDTLRANDATKDLPVVVLTNLHAGEDLQLATSKGANECVVKSKSDPMQVVAIAKKYLGQQTAGNGGGQQQAANIQFTTPRQPPMNNSPVQQPSRAQAATSPGAELTATHAAQTLVTQAPASMAATSAVSAQPIQTPVIQTPVAPISAPSMASQATNPVQPAPVSQPAPAAVQPATQPSQTPPATAVTQPVAAMATSVSAKGK